MCQVWGICEPEERSERLDVKHMPRGREADAFRGMRGRIRASGSVALASARARLPASPAQLHEERLEPQRGFTLNSSTTRHDSRTSAAARSAPVASSRRDVGPQVVQPVGVQRPSARRRGHDDEIAIPRRELLERREQLLALGATLSALHPLLARRARGGRGLDHRLLLALACRACPRRPTPRAPLRPPPARRTPRSRYTDRAAAISASRRSRAAGSSRRRARSSRPAATRASAVASRRVEPGRVPGDPLPHGALGEPPERDELAAGADRLRQRAELVGDEHDRRVARRLLEILQQRVGRILVEQVGVEHEVDPPVALERAHVQVVMQLADRRRSGSSRRAARPRAGRGASLATTRRSSPSSAPAKANAAVVLPTPAGPWRR